MTAVVEEDSVVLFRAVESNVAKMIAGEKKRNRGLSSSRPYLNARRQIELTRRSSPDIQKRNREEV